MEELRSKLQAQLAQMEAYLDLKRSQRDWHGVADAAMDIREIEASLRLLSTLWPDRFAIQY